MSRSFRQLELHRDVCESISICVCCMYSTYNDICLAVLTEHVTSLTSGSGPATTAQILDVEMDSIESLEEAHAARDLQERIQSSKNATTSYVQVSLANVTDTLVVANRYC